jgi:hypothetical protein
MNEVSFLAGETDADLRDRLDEELSAFNAAVTGHHDGRLLSIAVCGDRGDLRAGLYGWTWGGCGYIDLLWVPMKVAPTSTPRRSSTTIRAVPGVPLP